MKHSPLLIVIILLSLCPSAHAQQGNTPWKHDHQVWLQFLYTQELSKKWFLGVEEELRLDENVHRAQRLITEVTVRYKIIEQLKVGPLYRFAYKFHDPHVHRLGADLVYTQKIPGHFKIDNRLRYQVEIENVAPRKHSIRNRTLIFYEKHKVVRPFIGTELFFAFRNATDNGFFRYRLFLGSNFKINDHHTIQASYLAQVDRFHNKWEHVYRLGYLLNFGRKEKKEVEPGD